MMQKWEHLVSTCIILSCSPGWGAQTVWVTVERLDSFNDRRHGDVLIGGHTQPPYISNAKARGQQYRGGGEGLTNRKHGAERFLRGSWSQGSKSPAGRNDYTRWRMGLPTGISCNAEIPVKVLHQLLSRQK